MMQKLSRRNIGVLIRARMAHVHGTYYSILFSHQEEGVAPKIACTISKKVAPKATARNAAKRKCRAILSECLKGDRGLFILTRIKSPAIKAAHAELTRDMERLVERVRATPHTTSQLILASNVN